MSSALSLLKLDEMDEKEKRWFELERKNDLIKSMLSYVKLANEFLEKNRLNEINKMEEECDILATWFSTHYHCLYVPPYRESQKKNGKRQSLCTARVGSALYGDIHGATGIL